MHVPPAARGHPLSVLYIYIFAIAHSHQIQFFFSKKKVVAGRPHSVTENFDFVCVRSFDF